MQQIKDIQAYKELIRANKQRQGTVDTNCFLMPSAFERWIAQGDLYAAEYDNGVVLYADEGAYYTLYYFWKSGEPFADFTRGKPVVVEELNNRGARDGYLQRIEPLLYGAGFTHFKTNLQLERGLTDAAEIAALAEEKQAQLSAGQLHCTYCVTAADMRRVVALWESALDVADIPLDHKRVSDDAKVLCVMTADGRLAAASWWKHTNSTSESRHIVTDSAFYRQGLASTMLSVWLEDACRAGVSRCFTWISEHNFRSLSMYEKMGFVRNDRTSKQYILNKGDR